MGNKKPMIKALVLVICLGLIPRLLPAKQEQGGQDVKIHAWVEPDAQVITTRQVRFVIEISTPTWFAGGTRVPPPELAHAVVKNAGQFATNFTKNVKGNTWSVQQWTFYIFPLKEKTYRIPELPVNVTIADINGRPVPVEIRTPPVSFSAVIPDALKNNENWVAASRMTVREHYDNLPDTYEVGDAVLRRIDIEADGLPAMMLPVFTDLVPSGLAVYEDPVKITDDVNRGQIIGRRVEEITYLVEKPGTYRIPERIYSWYNIHTGQIEKIELPEKIISTQGFDTPASTPATRSPEKTYPVIAMVAITAGLFFLIVSLLLWNRRIVKRKGLIPSPAALKRAVKKAVKNGNEEEVTRIIYQWFDHYGGADGRYTHWRQRLKAMGTPEELRLFNDCMRIFYGPASPATQRSVPYIRDLRKLMRRRFFRRQCLIRRQCFQKEKNVEELRLT